MRNLILAILLLANTSFAGEISGRIYLETTSQNLGKIPVRMHVYKDDYEYSGAETMTDSAGRFRFSRVETGDRFSYILYPIYEGVNYPYKEALFEKGATNLKIDFPISESTGSIANIVASEEIRFEFGKKDIWKVTHDIILENKGDLLYHSGRADAQPILFSLFEGGFDLAYLEGVTRGNSEIDDEKDTLRVSVTLPGKESYKIRFSYYYLPSSRSVSFDRPAYIPHSNISLIFNRRVSVQSDQFKSDPLILQGLDDAKVAFTSGPIDHDKNITFQIKGYFLKQDFLHICLFASCLVVLALMIYAAIQYGKISKNQDKALTDKMLRYLMELQKQHKEGLLDEDQLKKEEHRVRNFLFQMFKAQKQ